MQAPTWLAELFRKVDAMDADGFVSYLAPDVTFKFGNAPEVVGKGRVREAVSEFFRNIQALHHEILDTWVHPREVICRGNATYTRKDGSQITLPFMNLFAMKGDLIDQYRVYVDPSPLFAPLSAGPESQTK